MKWLPPKAVHVESAVGEVEMCEKFSPEIQFLTEIIVLLAKYT